jgi:hypothetical protein
MKNEIINVRSEDWNVMSKHFNWMVLDIFFGEPPFQKGWESTIPIGQSELPGPASEGQRPFPFS